MLEKLVYLFFQSLTCIVVLIYPFTSEAQDYTVGVAVCDTIWTNERYWADDNEGFLQFHIDSCLYNYVTGLQFQVEIKDIQGFVYSNISDTVKAGDIFQLPTLAENGTLQISFTKFGDFFDFLIKIVGTPQIAGESYFSDITAAETAAIGRNILTIWPASDSIRTVQLPTAVNDNSSKLPSVFTLEQNYPNPFNPTTAIPYQLATVREVKLAIYNQRGQKVRTLVNQRQQGGNYKVQWDGRNEQGDNIASGVYLYSLITDNFVETRKMILLR